MTTAIMYDGEGRITTVRSGNSAGVQADAQASEQSYLLVDKEVDLDTHYVNVNTTRLTPDPEKPSDAHVFDYNTGTWGFDLSTAKHEAWSMIKVARDIEEFGTFAWSTHTFQCDEISQRRIQSAVQSAQLDNTVSVTWTLSDNTTQVFNATELQQIGQALSAHINACHDKARAKRSEIDSATTEEQINSVSW